MKSDEIILGFVLGLSTIISLSRKDIVDLILPRNDLNVNEKLDFVENYMINKQPYSEDQKKDIKHRFGNIKSEIRRRWSGMKKGDYFMKQNEDWLNKEFELPRIITKPGRPIKYFDEASERSKRRKTEELRLSKSPNKILYALKWSGGLKETDVDQKEISEDEDHAHEYIEAIGSIKSQESQISLDKALAMYVEANLTKAQNEIMKEATGNLPCYYLIQQEKKFFYHPKESFQISETCAEVKLQDVVNHTAQRLLQHLEGVLKKFSRKVCNTDVLNRLLLTSDPFISASRKSLKN